MSREFCGVLPRLSARRSWIKQLPLLGRCVHHAADFEKKQIGTGCTILPACDVPEVQLPEQLKREQPLPLPELSETDISRHYTALAKRLMGSTTDFIHWVPAP